MELLLEFIDTLIWPAIVLIGFVLFRKSILTRLAQAQKLRYKDFEIEFGAAIQAVTRDAEQAFPAIAQDNKARLLAKAHHFPSTTIREAWRIVDEHASALLQKNHPELHLPEHERFKTIARFLADTELLSTKQVKLFNELRLLRNKVAHAADFDVSRADSIQYVELCFRLIESLDAQKNS